MQVVDNPVGSGNKMITLGYPVKPGIDIAYIYSKDISNANMARMSSLSLRKKLEREGVLK